LRKANPKSRKQLSQPNRLNPRRLSPPSPHHKVPPLFRFNPSRHRPIGSRFAVKIRPQKKKVCYTTRDFVSDQNQPVLAVAVYDVQGEPQKTVRFLLPLGFMLAPGVRFMVDQGQSQPGKYAICFPNGCFAEVPVKDDVIAAFKKGQALMVSVQNQFGREVVFQVPLLTFGKVFDGPPIDPAVLAAEQKKMQDEMQRQAE